MEEEHYLGFGSEEELIKNSVAVKAAWKNLGSINYTLTTCIIAKMVSEKVENILEQAECFKIEMTVFDGFLTGKRLKFVLHAENSSIIDVWSKNLNDRLSTMMTREEIDSCFRNTFSIQIEKAKYDKNRFEEDFILHMLSLEQKKLLDFMQLNGNLGEKEVVSRKLKI